MAKQTDRELLIEILARIGYLWELESGDVFFFDLCDSFIKPAIEKRLTKTDKKRFEKLLKELLSETEEDLKRQVECE